MLEYAIDLVQHFAVAGRGISTGQPGGCEKAIDHRIAFVGIEPLGGDLTPFAWRNSSITWSRCAGPRRRRAAWPARFPGRPRCSSRACLRAMPRCRRLRQQTGGVEVPGSMSCTWPKPQSRRQSVSQRLSPAWYRRTTCHAAPPRRRAPAPGLSELAAAAGNRVPGPVPGHTEMRAGRPGPYVLARRLYAGHDSRAQRSLPVCLVDAVFNCGTTRPRSHAASG
jgi:hypothetical protein